jgi:cardiolipin synthase
MEFFFEGDDFFAALRSSLETAKKAIDIELYYFANDQVGNDFADILKKKASEGVKVRVIYDALGCRGTAESFFAGLRQAGVQVKVFHPFFPFGGHLSQRTHRKFFVVDGRAAFLGGFNLANEYSRTCSGSECWRDTGVSFESADREDLVQALIRLFQNSWEGLWSRRVAFKFFSGISRSELWRKDAFIMPHYGRRRDSRIRGEYLAAIIHARTSVHLTNAYFIPDRGIRRALRRAARRGVDVRILTTGVSDVPMARLAAHAIYGSLLRYGVRIYEYQGRVLHAKSATVDSDWYTVGTANLDHLSFFRNLEVNLFGKSIAEAAILEDRFKIDLAASREIFREEWRRRPWWKKIGEKFFFLFRAWL